MSEGGSAQFRMILPPDGRQTRIDFSDEQEESRSESWWHTFSSWFKHEDKEAGPDLDFFAQQLEKEGYSEKSRKTYLFMMKRFFAHFEGRSARQIRMGEIEDYNYEFFVSGRYSRSYQLQFINAIRQYYLLTEGLDLNLKQLRKSSSGRKEG